MGAAPSSPADAYPARTEKQLLEMISFQIQRIKPDTVPRPPYTLCPPKPTAAPSAKPKGKQPASAKPKNAAAAPPKATGGRRLPVPPDPLPPLASRVSPYSPALPTGVLIETIKAGMNAQENNQGAIPGAPAAGAGGTQKGKRKVVRVRG